MCTPRGFVSGQEPPERELGDAIYRVAEIRPGAGPGPSMCAKGSVENPRGVAKHVYVWRRCAFDTWSGVPLDIDPFQGGRKLYGTWLIYRDQVAMGQQPKSEIVVILGAVILTLGFVIAPLIQGPPQSLWGYCSPLLPAYENGTSYGRCSVDLTWQNVLHTPKTIAKTFYFGVYFDLEGYSTFESSVIKVVGTEPSGATQSFLISLGPSVSNLTSRTVLTRDGSFGATWDGGAATIVLLVRAS